MARNVEKEMKSARDLGNGTMELWVIFDTEEEVERAKAWMKGKQKVKNLKPMTKERSDELHAAAFEVIAKKLGIKGEKS